MVVLVIAPHPDDEILGCGGTIYKYAQNGNEVIVAIVTKGCEPLFSEESVIQVRNECKEADAFIGVKETVFMDFPAAMLETVSRYELNDAFVKLIQYYKPEIVFLPHRGDMQIDHKMVVDAAMVALRPKYKHVVKKIMAYETLSETGWDIPNTLNEFIPNVYYDISNSIHYKLEALKIFSSQIAGFPNARSLQSVEALAKYRGSMMNLNAAEAFSLIRHIEI